MLSASGILRLLTEDDPPAEPQPPPPNDPNQLPLDLGNPDDLLDPAQEITRLTQTPLRITGGEPPHVWNRIITRLGVRNRFKVANNTYVIRHDENKVSVRFHDTDVVTAFSDGRVVVDSGGWRPTGEHYNHGWKMPAGTTTMARINDWLSGTWQVYRTPMPGVKSRGGDWEGGEWDRYLRGGHAWEGHRLMYNDGDTIYPDGSLQIQENPVPIKPKRGRKQ